MPDFSEVFVASTARALNSAGVPCVLWGHCLLNIHGVPSIIGVSGKSQLPFHKCSMADALGLSIDFVIPDHLLAAGAAVLVRQPHLALCPDDQLCLTSSTERYTPGPAFHVHMEDSEMPVTLYLQSETLWFLPPLDARSVKSRHGSPDISSWLLIGPSSSPGARVGGPAPSSMRRIRSSSPLLPCCWRSFCDCTPGTRGNASAGSAWP